MILANIAKQEFAVRPLNTPPAGNRDIIVPLLGTEKYLVIGRSLNNLDTRATFVKYRKQAKLLMGKLRKKNKLLNKYFSIVNNLVTF